MRGGVEVELIQPALREGALQAGLNPFIERVGGASRPSERQRRSVG